MSVNLTLASPVWLNSLTKRKNVLHVNFMQIFGFFCMFSFGSILEIIKRDV